jgi:MFS family permease
MNKKAFISLSLAIFATMMGMSIVSPLMAVYSKSLGASGIWLGLMYSGVALTRALFQPISGWLSDRKDRKSLMLIGLIAYTVLSLGYAWAANLYQLTGVRLLHGAASSLVTPVAQAYVGDLTPKGKEGTYMNLFMMSMYLGMASGPFLGGLLNDSYGMSVAFYLMGAISATALLFLVIFVPRMPVKSKKDRTGFSSMFSLLKENRMRAVVLHLFSRAVLRMGITSFLPIFATEMLGMNTTTVGMVISIFIFTEAFSQGIVGPIADRINRKALLIGGTAVAAVLAFFIGSATSAAGMLLILVPVAITTSMARASASAYSVEIGAKLKCMGACMGLSNASQDLGSFVGPMLFGWATDSFGSGSIFMVGGITGVLAIPFIILSLMAKERPAPVVEEAVAK